MEIGRIIVPKKRIASCNAAENCLGVEDDDHQIMAGRTNWRKAKRRVPFVPMIQRVFDICKEVFRGPGTIPFPEDVLRLRQILDSMKPDDVGLNEEDDSFDRVTYMHVYECEKFSIGIFLLPQSTTIPLHNHPGMTVFSKPLFGSVRLRAYDWVEHDRLNNVTPPSKLARMKVNKIFTAPACKTSVLYPKSGGNIHSLFAETSCAILDVLGPPYSDFEGRDCMYYKESPYLNCFSPVGAMNVINMGLTPDRIATISTCYRWLEEIDKPEDFCVDGAEYVGPEIVEAY